MRNSILQLYQLSAWERELYNQDNQSSSEEYLMRSCEVDISEEMKGKAKKIFGVPATQNSDLSSLMSEMQSRIEYDFCMFGFLTGLIIKSAMLIH